MEGCDMDEADCAILEPRVRAVELFKGLKNCDWRSRMGGYYNVSRGLWQGIRHTS